MAYQQDEEDKEHVRQEEDGSQDSVGLLDLVEVEISQDGTEQGEDGVGGGAEVFDLELKNATFIKNVKLAIFVWRFLHSFYTIFILLKE